MIEFITSVPWWGWGLALVWFFCVVFNLQMRYINQITPAQKEQWLQEQANKKPWYMG